MDGWMNESINQSINQSVSQSVSQSIDENHFFQYLSNLPIFAGYHSRLGVRRGLPRSPKEEPLGIAGARFYGPNALPVIHPTVSKQIKK